MDSRASTNIYNEKIKKKWGDTYEDRNTRRT